MDEFGTLADWEELLAGLHERGIRLLMDLVVNHTSDEHVWFQESRKSKDNPYRNYYTWRPPKEGGGEPNNWRSFFGGSAWKLDPTTGEYYLHLFSKKQPDLNWENPTVRHEVYEIMDWWLQKGVDGFRMDVINMISKTAGLPDAPVTCTGDRYQFGGKYFICGPRLLEFLAEMKRSVLDRYDVMTVGETPMVTPLDAVGIAGEEDGSLNMVFQFEHVDLDRTRDYTKFQPGAPPRWSLPALKSVMGRWQKELHNKAWNSLYLCNHDQPRPVSRFGDDGANRVVSAKLLATLLHMQQGTPYIYQGEEIGMTNVHFASIDQYRDIETLNMYHEYVVEKNIPPEAAMAVIHATSRDNARTPMQWDTSYCAGFTTGKPWLTVNPNFMQINVAQALADPDSVLYYYRQLIAIRKAYPVVVHGSYEELLPDDEQLYVFVRTLDDTRLLVVLNASAAPCTLHLPEDAVQLHNPKLLISNMPQADTVASLNAVPLRPYEARVYLSEL
eukprot:TRINITY_DN2431_c0_g1_i2.p1 TRINITY_DN2431_c0_g1~~TRINITY_DN2431_c0_g1_i2.p1  ORF type:complete len:499 (-),score=128.89 TRINITY_DN2431_c0_g1_i2:61-1557(-)